MDKFASVESENAWKIFATTGKIDDYLRFANLNNKQMFENKTESASKYSHLKPEITESKSLNIEEHSQDNVNIMNM